MSEVVVVRRRHSRAEAETLVAEFEASGLKWEAFCQQGLDPTLLSPGAMLCLPEVALNVRGRLTDPAKRECLCQA